jgi:hypothetical protein
MWFQALNRIGKRDHWKLVVIFKFGCTPLGLPIPAPGNKSGDWTACDKFHQFALNPIKRTPASLLIISSASTYPAPNGVEYTPAQWEAATAALLRRVKSPSMRTVVIGSPSAPKFEGPACLSRHMDDVQACSGPPLASYLSFNTAEEKAAQATGVHYVNIIPWFCDKTCSFVIGNQEVYQGRDHVTTGYSYVLQGALAGALGLPVDGPGR